jgi:hypothetical protein
MKEVELRQVIKALVEWENEKNLRLKYRTPEALIEMLKSKGVSVTP